MLVMRDLVFIIIPIYIVQEYTIHQWKRLRSSKTNNPERYFCNKNLLKSNHKVNFFTFKNNVERWENCRARLIHPTLKFLLKSSRFFNNIII